MISVVLRTLATLLFAVAIFLVSGSIAVRTPSHESLDARASFLAVGDTGKVHRPLAALFEGQVAVGNDLAVEDRDHPVDALLLLGDNFYMHGLSTSELVPRIRQNLVYPYCHFVELEGPRSAEVASVCSKPALERPPSTLYAVLGNHDVETAESPVLQRDAIPEFISNWVLSTDFAVNREFDDGLSLIAFNSEDFAQGEANRMALIAALRAADGPWRVLAAHSPMAIGETGNRPAREDHSLEFQRWVQGVIEQAGVHVHLYLSGHHHSLQLLAGGGRLGPDMHVVVGSGARYRKILAPHPERLFQAERLGFARVDLVGNDEDSRLVVSLFLSPTLPLMRFGGPQLAQRWSIDRSGRLTRED